MIKVTVHKKVLIFISNLIDILGYKYQMEKLFDNEKKKCYELNREEGRKTYYSAWVFLRIPIFVLLTIYLILFVILEYFPSLVIGDNAFAIVQIVACVFTLMAFLIQICATFYFSLSKYFLFKTKIAYLFASYISSIIFFGLSYFIIFQTGVFFPKELALDNIDKVNFDSLLYSMYKSLEVITTVGWFKTYDNIVLMILQSIETIFGLIISLYGIGTIFSIHNGNDNKIIELFKNKNI